MDKIETKKKRYAAYYKCNPTFLEDKALKLSDVKNYFKKVRKFDAENLEDAFWKSQGESWSPNGEANSLIGFLGLKHTSMSVGDVLQDLGTGEYFQVMYAGFEQIRN